MVFGSIAMARLAKAHQKQQLKLLEKVGMAGGFGTARDRAIRTGR
jgi:hypothetical protein